MEGMNNVGELVGAYLALWIFVIIIALVIHIIVCTIASGIAKEKGHSRSIWFHICFWLPAVSFILVAALPDRKLLAEQKRSNDLLQNLVAEMESRGTGQDTDRIMSTNMYDDLPIL